MTAKLDLSAVYTILDKSGRKQQAIISILQEIQEVYHYLPQEGLVMIISDLFNYYSVILFLNPI